MTTTPPDLKKILEPIEHAITNYEPDAYDKNNCFDEDICAVNYVNRVRIGIIDYNHKKLALTFKRQNNEDNILINGFIDILHNGFSILRGTDGYYGAQNIETFCVDSNKYVIELPIGRLALGYGINIPVMQIGDFCIPYSGSLNIRTTINSPNVSNDKKLKMIVVVQ